MHTWQMKQLDENLPSDLEEFLDKSHGAETKEMLVREAAKLASDSFAKEHELAQKQEIVMVFTALNLCLAVRVTLLSFWWWSCKLTFKYFLKPAAQEGSKVSRWDEGEQRREKQASGESYTMRSIYPI